MISPARKLAFDILLLVEKGGYSTELLHARTASLDSRDAGLASELVLGVLRRQAQLDYLISQSSKRAAAKLDPEVRIALRMGIYQLRHLDRIPPHAAVSESVELVKRAKKVSAAGMVNAVLRKHHTGEPVWPDIATALSLPGWLYEKWLGQFGEATTLAIGKSFLERPEHYIRVPAGQEEEATGLGAQPTAVAGCFIAPRDVDSSKFPFRFQDIGSQSIVPMLGLLPGHTLLDLCAAPGNKTAQALEAGVSAVACDLHLSRLRLAGLACDRVVLDAARPLPFARLFDRILLDAPCSGTGTIGRNPEIRWRVQPEDFDRYGRLQVPMLCNALRWLKPGGTLVYSTCSLEQEENEQVTHHAIAQAPAPNLRIESMTRRTPGIDPGDGFFAAVITSN